MLKQGGRRNAVQDGRRTLRPQCNSLFQIDPTQIVQRACFVCGETSDLQRIDIEPHFAPQGGQLANEFDVHAGISDLEVMRLLVPTGNELPSLLEQVSTAARREGLDIASVEPQPIVHGEMFDTYKYKVSITGGYHALAEFMTNVGSLQRIVAPVNVSLGMSTNKNANAVKLAPAGTAAVESKFEIQTYVIRTAPAAQGGKS